MTKKFAFILSFTERIRRERETTMDSSTTTGGRVHKFPLKSIDEDECCNDSTETTFDESDDAATTPEVETSESVEETGYNDDWTYEECTIMEGQTIEGGGDDGCCNNSFDGDYTFVTIQDEDDEPEEEKYVRFNARTTIIIIPSTDDFTPKEKRRYWLLDEEKAKMDRRLVKRVTRMIAANSKSNNSSSSSSRRTRRYRGLENFDTSQSQEGGGGATATMKLIHAMITAVMDEQDQQWVIGINDSQRIATISQGISEENAIEAQTRAQHDETEALDVYARGTFFQDAIESMFFSLTTDDEDNNNFICRIAKKAAERQEKREQRAKRERRKLRRQKSSRRNVFQAPSVPHV